MIFDIKYYLLRDDQIQTCDENSCVSVSGDRCGMRKFNHKTSIIKFSFSHYIFSCQQMFLSQLHLDDNIARNTALCENVFMMVICTELRIPLFVVGKPGSSKSLAKTIILDNMQGSLSPSNLFKSFKQVRRPFSVCTCFQSESF